MKVTTAPETAEPWLRLRSVNGIGNLLIQRMQMYEKAARVLTSLLH